MVVSLLLPSRGHNPSQLANCFSVGNFDTSTPISASTMWRAFTQRLGVTPAVYRQRFAAVAAR